MDNKMIEPENLYPINTVRELMGWKTTSSWASARRRGIGDRIKFVGKRGYLLGKDVIAVVVAEGQQRSYETAQG